MGKKGSGSWLTAVKRAFTATRKQRQNDKDEKRGKRKWLFGKSPNNQEPPSDCRVKTPPAAAEEAATTNEAAETVRSATACRPSSASVKHHFAATLIQTSFRGYLARRAMRALKGIVTLQAVIRGQNVRKQATITLKCMQALLRVQSRLHDQRSRLSHDGSCQKPTIVETPNVWEPKYLHNVRMRKSMSRDESCIPDDWSDIPHTLEELDAIMQSRREANVLRDTSAFSQPMWKSNRSPSAIDEKDLEERASWLDRWIEAKQWESRHQGGGGRASFDRRDSIKSAGNHPSRLDFRSATATYRLPHYVPSSPGRRSSYSPITPSPIKTKPLQVRSASPRCVKEDRTHPNASLRSTPRLVGAAAVCHYTACAGADAAAVPNYMAATESAKARIRSQSTPRQRPSTPERDLRTGLARKRLAYPAPDPCGAADGGGGGGYEARYGGYTYNLRSPSFKSVQVAHVGMGQQSCYTDRGGGELSPCSTTDLRRWMIT